MRFRAHRSANALWLASPRSLTINELLQVFAKHNEYDISTGVWHMLWTPPNIPDTTRSLSLCERFGMSQEELDCMLGAAGLSRLATTWIKKIQQGTEARVAVFKKQDYAPGPYTDRISYARWTLATRTLCRATPHTVAYQVPKVQTIQRYPWYGYRMSWNT